MTTNKFIISLASFAVILSGCDYLNTTPDDTMTGEHYWNNADAIALQQYCNTYYPKLIKGHGDPNGWDTGDMFKSEYQSDNILPSGQNAVNHGANIITTEDPKWDWKVIRGCNTFINNYKKSPAAEAVKNNCVGQMYFFKAWDYFNKVCRYGDVPWLDNGSEKNAEDLYGKRDSRVVVMDKVMTTIQNAIDFLPTKTDPYMVSKDAAIALKARMALYEGTWRKYRNMDGYEEYLQIAYDAASELMKPNYGYSLYTTGDPETSYFNLFNQIDYRGNSEVILAKEYVSGINMGNDVSYNIPNASHSMSRDCFEEYLCSKTGLPISMCGCHNYKDGMVKEMLNRDLRLVQTIAVPDTTSGHSYYLYRRQNGKLEGGVPNILGALDAQTDPSKADYRVFFANSSAGYSICKYYNEEDWQKQQQHTGDTDCPVFRFAEILLIKAEAAAELGIIDQTILDATVNKLRERVGFTHKLTMSPVHDENLITKYPNVNGSNADLIREIRRERRVELFCEGLRWDDICRWHVGNEVFNLLPRRGAYMDPKLYTEKEIKDIKDKIGLDENNFILPYDKRGTLTPNFTEKNYLFNIPLNEITLNPNLTQNPGWE